MLFKDRKNPNAGTAEELLQQIEHHVGSAELHLTNAMVQLLKASNCHTEAVKQRAFATHPEFYTRLQERLHKLVATCRHFQAS